MTRSNAGRPESKSFPAGVIGQESRGQTDETAVQAAGIENLSDLSNLRLKSFIV